MIAVEVFAASNGWCFMSVPRGCGLDQATSLRIEGESMRAMRGRDRLPIDLPVLTAQALKRLLQSERIAVGEFMGVGLINTYFLRIEVIN